MRAHQGSLSPRSSWTCGRHLVEITSATNILDGRVCGRGWAEMRWIVELSNFSILLWRVLKVYVFSSILYSKNQFLYVKAVFVHCHLIFMKKLVLRVVANEMSRRAQLKSEIKEK